MAKPVPTPIVPNVPASSLGQERREDFAQGMYTHNVPWHNFIDLEAVRSFSIQGHASEQLCSFKNDPFSSKSHAGREIQGRQPDITYLTLTSKTSFLLG